MATKRLAKELGLIRKSRRAMHGSVNAQIGDIGQLFSYLIVIDFESTCWQERKNYAQEIIEFPAVLLNTSNGKTEAEFHTYVQPQEHPTLSEFCTELTGIRQTQVEAGVPLQVCLSQFARWLQTLQQGKNLAFLKHNIPAPALNPCAFVTWSDWDLGVCLEYECKRKQIFKPEMLNRWIDLRATYKVFYNRKPKGLNGALQDLGIVFSGREHSGLDDARNTAHLAWRMITDGCVLKLTKTLDRAPLKTKPVVQNPPKTNTSGNGCKKAEIDWGVAKSTLKHQRSGHTEKENKSIPEVNLNTAACQSLVTPRTLLGGLTSPLVQRQEQVQESLGCFSFARSSVSINSLSDTSSSVSLVSTTVDSINVAQSSGAAESTASNLEWEVCQLFPETEESCSYDDVILEDREFGPTSAAALDDTRSITLKAVLSPECASNSNQILFKNSNTTVYSVEKPSPHSTSSAFKIPTSSPKIKRDTSMSHPNASVLRYPKALSVLETSRKPSEMDMTACRDSHASYTDESHLSSKSRLSSGSSASLFFNRTSLPNARTAVKAGRSGTAPLCHCGRRARRLTVANGGPNHGRVFYSCPIGRNATGNKRNCGFFQWESAHLKAVSASTSQCFDRSSTSLHFDRSSTSLHFDRSSTSLRFDRSASSSLSERTFSNGSLNPFKKFFGTSLRH
ncbi:ERI1 exoribonuclease 2 [Paramormyrops kingsleyae]|uniref:ERI1 exoribonuclease 2 n=1 Tax=Paramormyrops kingsleyae TaxID=1676925 RepID=UPI003B96B77D